MKLLRPARLRCRTLAHFPVCRECSSRASLASSPAVGSLLALGLLLSPLPRSSLTSSVPCHPLHEGTRTLATQPSISKSRLSPHDERPSVIRIWKGVAHESPGEPPSGWGFAVLSPTENGPPPRRGPVLFGIDGHCVRWGQRVDGYRA